MTQRLFSIPLLLALLIVAGCSLLPPNNARDRSQMVTIPQGSTPTPIPTPIVPTKPTYKVQRGEVTEKIKFTGRIAPVQEQELFFRVNGWVRYVYITRDDFVETGQVLADLEIDDLERDLESKLLDLKRVQVRLDQAERQLATDIRRTEVDQEIAQIRLEAAQAKDLTPRQEQAAVDLERAAIHLQQVQAKYDEIAWRNDRVVREEAANLQQATLDYVRAKAAYTLAMQDITQHTYDLSILEREVKLVQITLDELNQGVDPLLVNDVEQAQLDVKKLEAAIADAQIIAPFDGQILSESLTEGREVRGHQTVAIIADLGEMEISADLSPNQLVDLVEGMPVVAYQSNRPGDTYSGYIRRLPYPYGGGGRSEGVEETKEDKSTRIRLEVTFSELDLEVGDVMNIEVVLQQKDDALWLPPQAVRKFEGRRFVVVQEGEIQRRVDVKIGIESVDRVEIEEGLTEGQIVIAP
jgi:multidrug efflux pump subunit AcrA (membrane-fusion protein)